MQTCTNCGIEVDKEPTVLCDDCNGDSEATVAYRSGFEAAREAAARAMDDEDETERVEGSLGHGARGRIIRALQPEPKGGS